MKQMFAAEQIWLLKEQQTSVEDADLYQARDFRGTTYYWKTKYGGMDVSVAKRSMAFENEDAKLKKPAGHANADVTAILRWLPLHVL